MGERWNAWMHLVRRLIQIHLSDQSDIIHWKLDTNDTFSVKSMYMDLINSGPILRSLHILKIKMPLRIKISMWFLHKGVVLTNDNLIRRRWVGSSTCCYCDQTETIKHLFLDCPLAKLFGALFTYHSILIHQ